MAIMMASTLLVLQVFLSLVIERGLAFQYVGNNSMPANVSVACNGALVKDIACDPYVRRFRPGQYYSQEGLTKACTASCDGALSSYEAGVVQACKGQTYMDDFGFQTQEISTIPGILRYQYNKTCLRNDGKFCNLLAYQAAQGQDDQKPLGASATNIPTVDPCDDCLIKNLQFEAGSSYYDGPKLAPVYSSKTSSCKKTGFPLPTSTTSSGVPDPTTTKAPCTGKGYQIQSGDDCNSIAKSQKIGTAWLLTDNNLNAYCDQFPKSGSLCLTNTCEIYTVKANDTCQDIVASHPITLPQLLAWNPIINLKCSNLYKMEGDQICVGAPGSQYSAPTTSFQAVTSAATAAPVPTDVADETNHKCGRYYKAVVGDYCNLVIVKFGISLDDFVFLNPAINSKYNHSISVESNVLISLSCTNLFADESYCVLPVGNSKSIPIAPCFHGQTDEWLLYGT